jgi:hypothetical protein
MLLFALVAMTIVIVFALSRERNPSRLKESVLTAKLELDDALMAVFPDRIHLSRCWRGGLPNAHAVRRACHALKAEGFEDAGTFAIDELPGIAVALLANPRESMYAVVHDHARAGAWISLVTRYASGRRWEHTTLDGSGIGARAETTLVCLPGASVGTLLERARGDRPRDVLRPVTRRAVAANFEQGYADWIYWRKTSAAATTVNSPDAAQERWAA